MSVIEQKQTVEVNIIPRGNDGISPKVTVDKVEGGHKVTFTDLVGDHAFTVLNGKDGEDGTFLAEYGVTTREEILEKYNAGYACYCVKGVIILPFVSKTLEGTSFGFSGVYNNKIFEWYISNSNTWTENVLPVLRSTDTVSGPEASLVPTNKAVIDYVAGRLETVGVFYAEYGVTTLAEVKAAVEAGKIVYVKVTVDDRDQLLPMMGSNSDYSDLTFADFTFGGIVYRKLCFYKVTANGWIDQTIQISRFLTEKNRDDSTLVTTHGIATYFEENNNMFVVRETSNYVFDKTYAEMKAAREAGKLIMLCSYNGYWYYLYKAGETFMTGEYDDSYTFMPMEYAEQHITFGGYKVSSSDVWEFVDFEPPHTTTIINGRIESTRPPTAKAVYDFVKENGSVFVAEYGVTTHAEILKASEEGRVCFCRRSSGGTWLPLTISRNEPCGSIFSGYMWSGNLVYWQVGLDDKWTETSISAATKEYVDTMLGVIENGAY